VPGRRPTTIRAWSRPQSCGRLNHRTGTAVNTPEDGTDSRAPVGADLADQGAVASLAEVVREGSQHTETASEATRTWCPRRRWGITTATRPRRGKQHHRPDRQKSPTGHGGSDNRVVGDHRGQRCSGEEVTAGLAENDETQKGDGTHVRGGGASQPRTATRIKYMVIGFGAKARGRRRRGPTIAAQAASHDRMWPGDQHSGFRSPSTGREEQAGRPGRAARDGEVAPRIVR